MQRRRFIKAFALSATVVSMGLVWSAQAADTIKIGIMHSLSGTMAISETPLKDIALMTIDDINAKGGVLGKKIEPVVVERGGAMHDGQIRDEEASKPDMHPDVVQDEDVLGRRGEQDPVQRKNLPAV